MQYFSFVEWGWFVQVHMREGLPAELLRVSFDGGVVCKLRFLCSARL